jgi:hypothetical protein
LKKKDYNYIFTDSPPLSVIQQYSYSRGGGDEVDKEEYNGEKDKQNQGEVTLPQNPPDDTETSKKINFSVTKPTSQKKSKDSKPKLQNVLTIDDFEFIIAAISAALEDIL